jgi:F-type H+-transporting ATPase subunit b
MPQLDITTWPAQLIWLAIAFISLYLVMRFVALPKVGGVIETRSRQVADDLKAAERVKLETEKAIADYEAVLADARSRGNTMGQEARRKLSNETAKDRARFEAELNGQTAAAERSITIMKQKAMGEVDQVAAEIAAEIVSELAGIGVNAAPPRLAGPEPNPTGG